MKGDFSRITFDPTKHYSGVLMQQGRVQLDADWNEEGAIKLYGLRALAEDLGGPHWGTGTAFALDASHDENGQPVAHDFSIGAGHYYVHGILCENEAASGYKSQHDFAFPDSPHGSHIKSGLSYLAYLDVCEHHITSVQDDSIREKALGGPDTATRSQVVWQVKLMEYPEFDPNDNTALKDDYQKFLDALGDRKRPGSRTLEVRAIKPSAADTADACNISPESRYRGENQLYVVEIHHAGSATAKPTFKWSRDNGSIVFPVRSSAGAVFTLENLSRGSRILAQNDWVEVTDDAKVLRGESGHLLQVAEVNANDMTATLTVPSSVTLPIYAENDPRHPLLRLWDSEGELTVEVPAANDGWIPLEDGIEVRFEAGGSYQKGDYWWFAARVTTGDVEWPQQKATDGSWVPAAIKPQGIIHHYAPLAVVAFDAGGILTTPVADQRRLVNKLWS